MRKCLFAVVAIAFVGCVNKRQVIPSHNYMILDKVAFVDKFPESFQLDRPEQINLDGLFGSLDFAIKDSLIILSTKQSEGMWAFYSLPDLEFIGRYLRQGNGPNEFFYTPWLYNSWLYTKNGQILASVYDFYKGRLLEINISQTLNDEELNIVTTNTSLPPSLLNFAVIDKNTFFCRSLTDSRIQQDRYLLRDGKKQIPKNFEKLNRAQVSSSEEDFNILGAITLYNHKSERIIEAPIMLNYINIYAPDDSFGKTICTDATLYNISEIQLLDEGDRRYTYNDLRVYDDMFGVLRTGEVPVIQFFDMDGLPLAEFAVDRQLTSFDIDFRMGMLYIHNLETEEFFRYDIKNILNKIGLQ